MLSELAPMASVGPVTLEEVLVTVFACSFTPPPSVTDVFSWPVEAARGLSFEAIFVPGWPRSCSAQDRQEPILLDAARDSRAAELARDRRSQRADRHPLGPWAMSTACAAYAPRLVALAPDVILANSSQAVAALQQVTRTVSIVSASLSSSSGCRRLS